MKIKKILNRKVNKYKINNTPAVILNVPILFLIHYKYILKSNNCYLKNIIII